MSNLAAKASGFPRAFIHGYASKAYAANLIVDEVLGGQPEKLTSLDVQFKKPLFTGLDVGIYVGPAHSTEANASRRVDIGAGPGESSFVTGTFATLASTGKEQS